MKKTIIWGTAIIITIFILVGIAYFLSDDETPTYSTYEVSKDDPLILMGKAMPEEIKNYNYHAHLGTINEILVGDGDEVIKGDEVVSYNTGNSDLKKYLDEDDGNTDSDNDDLLEEFDTQIEESTLASFDGHIVYQSNLDNVENGETILQILSNNTQIRAVVSEVNLEKIESGDTVNIIKDDENEVTGEVNNVSELPVATNQENIGEQFDAQPSSFNGATLPHDSEVGLPESSNPHFEGLDLIEDIEESSEYEVIIDNINSPLRAGMTVEIEVPIETISLPSNVLIEENQVFILNDDGTVKKQEIDVESKGNTHTLNDGLNEGETLIMNPHHNLEDGDYVEVNND